ncbi:alpha-1,6-mannosyltransferase [Candida albicans P78042]|nr:alpha-1,6-mannosyltransferase [Candida albicans P57055]KHC67894.1 alpha-1,6-mannosyltransferase [Candida albicans P78042]
MYRYNKVLDATLIALVSFHLVISPFTKVEESFNIQAIHDILKFGIFPLETIDNYDHKQFPGVVPRTFLGSLVVAGLAKPILLLSSAFGFEIEGYELQKLVRAVLGLVNVLMLIRLRDSINKITFSDKKSKRKGLIGFWYTTLLLSQFHLLYYSSRTLPNFIALPLVNFSLSKIIQGDLSGLTWLAFTGIVFRLEVGLFGLIIAIVSSLGFGQSNIFGNIIYLAMGTLLGGFSSFCIDSYFWGRPLIPEIDSFIFNIVQGKSTEWGTEPWDTYFKKYLFQLFRPPVILMLAIPGLINDPANDGTKFGDKKSVPHPARYSLRILFISSILFIAAMSFQPHKEWRFIVYTIPIFTLQAANGVTNICQKWGLSVLNKVLIFIIGANVIISSLLSLHMGYISSFNYPGGDALQFTNNYILENYKNETVSVHMDVPACMTGITRFGELDGKFASYDKSEQDFDITNYDIIITHNEVPNWELLHSSRVFDGISLRMFIQIFMAQRKDRSTIFNITKLILSEFAQGEFGTVHDMLRSTITTVEYLNVYKNVNKNPHIVQGVPETEIIDQEIDPEEIRQDVNEQIDKFESAVL